MSDRPEEDRSSGVERESHEDRLLVAELLEDHTSDRGEGEVSDTEVGDLESGRLELGDAEHVLAGEEVERTRGRGVSLIVFFLDVQNRKETSRTHKCLFNTSRRP